MSLLPGARLGPYEILSALGVGGMGEVYKARDTRLDRTVAIKILPETLAADPAFRERFHREARAISQLDHPHICALYDVGEQNGTAFLVMQYLDGHTLQDRLISGKLPLDQALKTAIELLSALEKAHRAGITHRDVKPGNIMLTNAGAKLLDFGLAKSGAALVSDAGLSTLPTTPPHLTAEGMILGTFQYMAPEQLEGLEADARTDLFSFGAVLYEMVTGTKAFQGKSQASLISAIMASEPTAVSALQPLAPPALDHVIDTCLAKNPDDRWQSAGDLRRELKWVMEASPDVSRPASVANWHRRDVIALWVAAVAILSALSVGAVMYRGRAISTPVYRTTILPPDNVTVPEAGATTPADRFALSPNGRWLAFVATGADQRTTLWVRPLDSLAAQRLTGTDGASSPFWSPDSRFIGFYAQGKLKKIDATGGPAQPLADAAPGRGTGGGTWNQDDVIVFVPKPRSGLFRVSAAGGMSSPVTVPDAANGERDHLFPVFLPDGRHFLYVSRGTASSQMAVGGVYVGSLDSTERKQIFNGGTNTTYAHGSLLFLRGTTLVAQPFDTGRLELSGDPVPLAEQVELGGLTGTFGAFATTDTGLIAYQTRGNDFRSQLTWFDRAGTPLTTVGDPAEQMDLELSPDASKVAVSVHDPATNSHDIWIRDPGRGDLKTRVTSDPADEMLPIWSSDSRLVFNSSRRGVLDLYEKAATSGSQEQLLSADSNNKYPTSWSPDGKFLLYFIGGAQSQTGNDLWVLPASGAGKPWPVRPLPFAQIEGRFSPNGRWIAYASNDSGRWEVHVMPFAGVPSESTRAGQDPDDIQVSSTGGIEPRWRRDGTELFFLSADNKLMAASVDGAGSTFKVGKVKELFEVHVRLDSYPKGAGVNYDVAPDGQQFLVNSTVSKSTTAPITLIVNWPAALKK